MRVLESWAVFHARRPNRCLRCGSVQFEAVSDWVHDDFWQGQWVCQCCGARDVAWLYLNTEPCNDLWTEEQVAAFGERREQMGMSMRAVSALTGIRMTRLMDFERRLSAPTEHEQWALKVFGLIQEPS